MSAGAKWSWRDTQTQIWLLQQAALNGDSRSVIVHGDALARRDRARHIIFPLFATAATDASARDLLVEQLVERPSWRTDFLRHLGSSNSQAPERFIPLLVKLARTNEPPVREEAVPILQRLVETGKARDGRNLWLALFLPLGRRQQDFVFDGGFEVPIQQSPVPFEWDLRTNEQGLAVVEVPTRSAHGKALFVEYDGVSAVDFAAQILVLPPGRYAICAKVLPQSERASRAFSVTLRCSNESAELVSTLPQDDRSEGWRNVAATIQIPSTGCSTQLLQIVSHPGDYNERVSAWIDDIAIRPWTG